MEWLPPPEWNNILLTLVFIGTSIGIVQLVKWWVNNQRRLPPGPVGVPFFGYWPTYLSSRPYEVFDSWAKKYGEVFSIRICGRLYVVLNTYSAIRLAYNRNGGNNCNSRPEDFNVLASFFQFRGLPFKNGREWAFQRKLFSYVTRRSDVQVEGAIMESAHEIVKQVDESEGQPIDMYRLVTEGILNVISTIVMDQRLVDTDPEVATQIINDARTIFANSPGGDGFLAGWIMRIRAHPFSKKAKLAQEISSRQFKLMERFIIEHEKNFDPNNPGSDFIDSCIRERRDEKLTSAEKYWLSNKFLVANMFVFFVAGVESTACNLYFALFLLAKYPDIQEKCYEELTSVLGESGEIKVTDRPRLPYITAVLNEISRYIIVGPLPQPRQSDVPITNDKWHIPAGTHFITNLWSATRDSEEFDNPRKFDPNNFYKKERPRDLCTLAFSVGKRGCPGESLASLEIFLIVTHLIQNFKMGPVPGEELKEQILEGFTRNLAPFKLNFTKRY